MNKKKFLLSLSLTSLLYADVGNITFKNGLVEVEVTQTYNMGDRDSKMDAFRYASEAAKVEASEAAGTYIESNFELIEQQTNGTNHTKTAKRTLKTLSASVMRFTVTNEELKHPTLTLKAKAVVDTKALQQKIAQNEALQQKEQEVDKLTKHNKKLLEEIQALNIQIPNITTTSQALALIQKRNELLGKMEQNGNELKVTLDVKGMKEAYQEEVDELNKLRVEYKETLKIIAKMFIPYLKTEYYTDSEVKVKFGATFKGNNSYFYYNKVFGKFFSESNWFFFEKDFLKERSGIEKSRIVILLKEGNQTIGKIYPYSFSTVDHSDTKVLQINSMKNDLSVVIEVEDF